MGAAKALSATTVGSSSNASAAAWSASETASAGWSAGSTCSVMPTSLSFDLPGVHHYLSICPASTSCALAWALPGAPRVLGYVLGERADRHHVADRPPHWQ